MDHFPPREPAELMTLPVEVRVVIYQHLFSYDRPLYTSERGKLIMNSEARKDMAVLRTCRKFYCEAMPQIYAINSLEVAWNEIKALAHVPQCAEILVGKVIVHCKRHIPSAPGIIDDDQAEVEDIDFGLIGQACPNVNHLEIKTSHAGSLLWVTQKLIRSLPCSPIREWPLLRVEVHVNDAARIYDNDNFEIAPASFKGVQYGGSVGNATWLMARSSFRLGHELPKYLKSIRVHGSLSKRLCRLLEKHVCSFGDCSFKRKKFDDKDSSGDGDDTGGKRIRYTWHKTGDVIPQDEEKEAKIMAAMNQWVPKLDLEEYAKMSRSGYDDRLSKSPSFIAAKLPHMDSTVTDFA